MYNYLPHSDYNRTDGFVKLVSIGGNEHYKSKLSFNITFFAMYIPLTSKWRNGNTFHPNEIDFGLLASHTVREYISVVLSNQPSLWSFVTSVTENLYSPLPQLTLNAIQKVLDNKLKKEKNP